MSLPDDCQHPKPIYMTLRDGVTKGQCNHCGRHWTVEVPYLELQALRQYVEDLNTKLDEIITEFENDKQTFAGYTVARILKYSLGRK